MGLNVAPASTILLTSAKWSITAYLVLLQASIALSKTFAKFYHCTYPSAMPPERPFDFFSLLISVLSNFAFIFYIEFEIDNRFS
jgi:hypothetical protein